MLLGLLVFMVYHKVKNVLVGVLIKYCYNSIAFIYKKIHYFVAPLKSIMAPIEPINLYKAGVPDISNVDGLTNVACPSGLTLDKIRQAVPLKTISGVHTIENVAGPSGVSSLSRSLKKKKTNNIPDGKLKLNFPFVLL